MATTPWVAGLYAELVSLLAPPPRQAAVPVLGWEERSVALPPLPPGAEHYYADLFAYKSYDARAWLRQILDEDTRRELLPVAPTAFDDWHWSAWFGVAPTKWGNEGEWSTFTPPAIPPPLNLGWDEFEWNRAFSEAGLRMVSASDETPMILLKVPFIPDDFDAARYWGSQGLAGLVALDEFVNAPSGSGPFGPAPRGRSVRLGFSISAFR